MAERVLRRDDVSLAQLLGDPVFARQRVPADEQAFRNFYALWSTLGGINPNPDDPRQQYDYRAAYRRGAVPGLQFHGPPPDAPGPYRPERFYWHWPSEYKGEEHPNRYVNGIDTRRR